MQKTWFIDIEGNIHSTPPSTKYASVVLGPIDNEIALKTSSCPVSITTLYDPHDIITNLDMESIGNRLYKIIGNITVEELDDFDNLEGC
ncbi:MAG: hypothetical protein ACOCQD_03875 [archaeon]